MQTQTQATPISKQALWIGYVLSLVLSLTPVLMLLMSGVMKLVQPPAVVEGFNLIPRTSVLGAILLTGHLGGAILTHLRVGEAVFAQVLLGVACWGGLFLRDSRLRVLIPLRRPFLMCVGKPDFSGKKKVAGNVPNVGVRSSYP